ncbi:hypothetical protein C8R45DRAFT_125755 [Mycena sanguinolenta]|nr:hypothetical protein C8R45DRAFT_125755 [Mycena sanguinolenta]
MDFLLRPLKAPSIQEFFLISPVSIPPTPRRPGWDTSWTGMVYGGDPIYALILAQPMLKKLLQTAEPDWLVTLWAAVDDTYLAKTSKSINDYWEVPVVAERPPQWHDKPERVEPSSPYVPPPVSQPSDRVQSAYSYLASLVFPEGNDKQKTRPPMSAEEGQRDTPPVEIVHEPLPQHPVYELPKKTAKILYRLLRQKIEGAPESEGKVTWKDVCKVFRAMNFIIDDTTPGSAVNFIPPSAEDRSITIHRPHPDPELTPLRVRQLGARLRRVYGWSEAWFKASKAAE